MEPETATSLTDRFFNYTNEMVAELKSRKLSKLDADLLQLKMTELTGRFDEFKSGFDAAAKQKKARAAQETFSQGLANTTAMRNTLQAIEKNANNEMTKASRAHSHALNELMQLKRAVNERSRGWWKKLLDR
jgi:hypothetical protein